MDHYEVLGVSRTAPHAVVKAAYHALLREHHPDRTGEAGVAMTQRINDAGKVLLDPARRAQYDAELTAADRRTLPRPTAAPPPQPGRQGPPPVPGFGAQAAAGAPPVPGWTPGGPGPGAGPGFGPGAAPLKDDPAPQPWPDLPDFLSSQGSSARRGWFLGTTWLQRVSGALWLALTLIGPVWTVVAIMSGDEDRPRWWTAAWAVVLVVSISGAISRIRHRRPSVRYFFTWVGAIVTCVFKPEWTAYIAVWLVLYAVAVETRRYWRWDR